MTFIRICDACGEEMPRRPRVEVKLYLRWDDIRTLDFHAKEDCLLELPDMVKKLTKEVRV